MKTNLFLILFIPFVFSACSNKPEVTNKNENSPDQFRSLPLNTKEGYTLNEVTGDSIRPVTNSAGVKIQTGVSVPASGKTMEPSSIHPPVIIPARKLTQPLRSNSVHIDHNTFPASDTTTNKPVKINFGMGDSSFVL